MAYLSRLAGFASGIPTCRWLSSPTKPVVPSRAICEHFGLDCFFFANYGGDSFPSKKPHPGGLLTLIAEASALRSATSAILPEDTVMIGDSHVDIETAKAAGTRSLGCTFGLSPRSLVEAKPDFLVERANDWPDALGL